MALKDSRFSFSATDRSSSLAGNVSNQSKRLQILRFNPTHSNIDDDGNNDKDGSNGDEDSDKDSIEDEDNDSNDNNDGSNDNNGVYDYNNDDDDDIYQDDNNTRGDIGEWLPKSLVIFYDDPDNRN